VAGDVKATGWLKVKGIEFADGTTQTAAADKKRLGSDLVPNIGGTGSANRIAKWMDNAGNLTDSIAIDSGNGLQMTVAPNGTVDTNLLFMNSTNGTMGMLAGSTASYGAANGPFFALRGNTYSTIAGQRGMFTIGAGNVASPVGDDGSVKFNTGNDQLRMVIRPNGNVGIGTSTPGSLLDVNGNLNVTGNATISGNIAAKYQDIAEWTAARTELAAGTVVILDPLQTNRVMASHRAYDTRVAGVVSAQPGVILGEGGPRKALVATTGRVRVRVNADRGAIHIGDLLVTSDMPGVAMKSLPFRVQGKVMHRPGTIIGKALEPLAKGKGTILVLLSLQ
jgi:hypothetical protein